MQNIDLDIKHVYGTVSEAAVDALMPEAKAGLAHLVNADAAGNDFLGWLDLLHVPTRLLPPTLKPLRVRSARTAT